MEQQTEEVLVAAARGGDRAALEALLLRHQAAIYGFSLRMCRDPEQAREILQETLLAMARKFAEFRGGSAVSTWAFTIARRFCLKGRRRGRSVRADPISTLEGTRGMSIDAPHPGPGPEDRLHNRQVGEAVSRAVSALAPAYREVFLLRDLEGLSTHSVAEILGIRAEAVKSRLHRARADIREALQPLLGERPSARQRGCPDILSVFSRHLEGEISADLCATMERHVEACESCRGRCDSLQRTLKLCRTAPSPKVPAPVQASVRKHLRETLRKIS